MAVAMYYTWEQQGRPLTPAKPIAEIIARMKAAFPAVASSFSYYANDEHYQSNTPGDHTPFSHDGYKVSPSPYPVVFATDIMCNTAKGVDCQKLFNYWLSEAKAGRMQWLKYLIWQAKIYDVRHGWVAQANSDHFDHIHISTRTDYQNASLGTWSLLPGGLPIMTDFGPTDTNAWTQALRIQDFKERQFPALNTKLDALAAKLDALAAPEPAPVDLDAVRVIVREELDKTHLSD
jgi:hypothetical protein